MVDRCRRAARDRGSRRGQLGDERLNLALSRRGASVLNPMGEADGRREIEGSMRPGMRHEGLVNLALSRCVANARSSEGLRPSAGEIVSNQRSSDR